MYSEIVFLILFLFFLDRQSISRTDTFKNYFGAFICNNTHDQEIFRGMLQKEKNIQEEAFATLKKKMKQSYSTDEDTELYIHKRMVTMSELSAEAYKELELRGIEDPTSNEKILGKGLVKLKAELNAAEDKASKAEYEKDACHAPVQGVQMQRKMEEQIEDLYPGGRGKLDRRSYFNAMAEILTSTNIRFRDHSTIITFRNTIKKEIGIENFLKGFRKLYCEFKKSIPTFVYYKPILPNYDETTKLQNILKCLGIKEKKNFVAVMSLILKPMEELNPKTPIIPLEEYRCVRLTAHSEVDQEKLNTYFHNNKFMSEDIRALFTTTDPVQIKFHHMNGNIDFIRVHFKSMEVARKAQKENNKWLKDIHIVTEHTACNGKILIY